MIKEHCGAPVVNIMPSTLVICLEPYWIWRFANKFSWTSPDNENLWSTYLDKSWKSDYWKSFFLRFIFWRLLSNDSCDLAKDISIDLCIHYPQQSLRIMDMWNWWRLQVELTYFDKSLKFDGESSFYEFFILETIFQWLVWLG